MVDLRERLGLPAGAPMKATRIVVAETAGTRVGLIVNGVSEVLMVPPDAVEAPAALAAGAEAAALRGIATLGERLILLLDLSGLFAADADELAAVA